MKMQKSVIFANKNLKINMRKIKNIEIIRDHYTVKYRGAAQSICNLKCSVPKKIPVAFHNGSNYDYNFSIKQ